MDLTNRFKVYDNDKKRFLTAEEIPDRVRVKYDFGKDDKDWAFISLERDENLEIYYAKAGRYMLWKPITAFDELLVNKTC